MKRLIVLIVLCTIFFVAHGQEYKVVCKRLTGCPVINGTCPTCEIVGIGKTQEELDARLEKILKAYRAEYNEKYKLKNRKIKPGWEWNGPTWNGLWVLRNK